MKLLDRFRSTEEDNEPEVTYRTEHFETTKEYTIEEAKIVTHNGNSIVREGEKHGGLIFNVEPQGYRLRNGEIIFLNKRQEIVNVPMDNIDYSEVLNTKTLRVEAEAEVNYKKVGDQDKEYTSIKSSNIEKDVIE